MPMCSDRSDRRALAALLGVVALLLSACAGSSVPKRAPADLSPGSLYPLRAQAAWSYDVDSGDGETVLAVARVTRSEGSLVEVTLGSGAPISYVRDGSGIARAGGKGHLLRAPIAKGATWPSGEGTTAEVKALQVTLTTTAGTFADCVIVQEDNTQSGQRITTTYCPGVGPAEVVSEMQVRGQSLRVVAKLRGYSVE